MANTQLCSNGQFSTQICSALHHRKTHGRKELRNEI